MGFPYTPNVDPQTMHSLQGDHQALNDLYRAFLPELVRATRNISETRAKMLREGYNADFADRESEMLYLLVRALQPEVVVEISPHHGYSTNYILAGLTDNGKGKLYSYEIMQDVRGKPIEEVIRGNLHPDVDQSRLSLVIGDATKADIPAADFMFIDSCHEAYFAAWFLEKLTHKPKYTLIHDIVIRNSGYQALMPKAPFLGLRESFHVLEALYLNGEACLAIAEFEPHLDPAIRSQLAVRYEDGLERSIVLQQHTQNKQALELHAMQFKVEKIREQIFFGDRHGALDEIAGELARDIPFTSRLQVALLLPLMSYRYPLMPSVYPDLAIDFKNLSVVQYIGLLELALTSVNDSLMRRTMRGSVQSSISPNTLRYLNRNYLSMVDPFWKLARRARNLMRPTS